MLVAMSMTAIAEQFFAALQANDAERARALCAQDFAGSQNGGPAMSLETLLKFTAAVHGVVPDFHYENPVRSSTATGFVEEHDVCGTLPDGSALRLPVCVVAEVKDGKISAVREYLDSARAAGLLKALGR